MGRGDKRTKKGKITAGSFGKSRLKRKIRKVATKATEVVAE
jgi:ribosomal small subunit protein bTHX